MRIFIIKSQLLFSAATFEGLDPGHQDRTLPNVSDPETNFFVPVTCTDYQDSCFDDGLCHGLVDNILHLHSIPSYSLYQKFEVMEQSDGHFPVQAIRVVGECYCVGSIHQYAHMIAINFRIHRTSR